ncbi:helix-turn-helix domain-containing protein [Geomonas anaerohicana]|uniref:Helix-turn-helix transcriptional regulator n=1 Tax=Geomonas anaerohicana TaxID=2798583 RepID=A0ABS0YGD4_9BACT|nr:helix-turn-helix transcriptional regulator [Geomonas anaerohicana]MBJ6751351.1 helix-turn-helix transcriptional regulator [Geomonas anaerohicana]
MNSTKELLGLRIRELRKTRELSQDQLSEKIGIDAKHLSRIELGKSFPYMETLEGIAEALDVEIKDLFEFHHVDIVDKGSIERLLLRANEKKLRLIFKIVKAIVD